MTKILLNLLILLSCCGCQAAFQDWQKERLLSHLSKIDHYHGTIVESGILDSKEDLISEVWFQNPGRYLAVIRAPEKQAGTKMSFDGKTLEIFYPKTKFGIVFKNLKPITITDFEKIISDQFRANMSVFDYEIGRKGTVANFPVVELDFKSKFKDSLIAGGSSRVYDEYSFPLQGEMKFRNLVSYSFQFKEIFFNQDQGHPQFNLIFPADTIISEWDLNSKAISEAETRKAADFKFQLAKKLPRELKLDKIIRQKGPLPAFTALYGGGPYFLNVMFFKNYGFSAIPTGRGLKIQAGNIVGDLIPNPHVNSYSFVQGDTQYVFVGNIPVEEMISAAASLN